MKAEKFFSKIEKLGKIQNLPRRPLKGIKNLVVPLTFRGKKLLKLLIKKTRLIKIFEVYWETIDSK